MRQLTFTILILITWEQGLTQEKEIFPDHVAINNKRDIGQILWTDQIHGLVTVKTTIIKNGKITDEIFDNYQPAFGKYPIDGVFKYKYGTADFPEERLYYNSKEDTLKVKYFFTKNNIRKQETWESERRSKLRKGAPEYGDGKPGGCIPAEEDLIRYRKWVKRGIFIYESSDNRLNTIKVCYDYSGNYPESIVFTYKDDLLINKKALGMRGKRINWEENYEYKDGKVIMTKKNYITYWGKIPPTRKWTYEFDSNKREIKVTKELEGQLDKEILSKEYYNNGNLKRLTKTINGTETTIDYLVTYR